MKVSGYHKDGGRVTCSGSVYVQVEGSTFKNPLAAGGLAVALAGNGAWSLDRLLGLVYPDWLLPAWLVLMAVGVVLALGVRSMQAPATFSSHLSRCKS